jgi:phosphoserine phosphatase
VKTPFDNAYFKSYSRIIVLSTGGFMSFLITDCVLPTTVTGTIREWSQYKHVKTGLFTCLTNEEFFARLRGIKALNVDNDETLTYGRSYWRQMEDDLCAVNPRLLAITKAHMDHCLRLDPNDHYGWRKYAKEPFDPHLMELLQEADAATWTMHMFFYQLYGKTRGYLRELARKVWLRDGVPDLLKAFPLHRITTSGYAEIVRIVCEINGIEPYDVAGFEFLYEEGLSRGKILGIHPGTMVTSHTKVASTLAFLGVQGIERSELMAIGDSYWDIPMMTEEGLGVLIVDPDRLDNPLVRVTLDRFEAEWGKRVHCVLFARDYIKFLDLISHARS